jgi:hypothetical protein
MVVNVLTAWIVAYRANHVSRIDGLGNTTRRFVLTLVFQFDDVHRLNHKVQSNYLVDGNRGNIEDDQSVFDSEWNVLAGYQELCLFHPALIWNLYA